jgi:hypothetical protein
MRGSVVRRAAAGVLVALIAVACGSAASPAPSVTPSPTASPSPTAAATASPSPSPTAASTPTPEPTVDVAAAGDAYLAMASRLSTSITAAFDELAAREHPEAEYIQLNQDAADAYRTAIADLAAIEFPAEVTDEVDELVGVLDALAKEFEHTVADPSYDNVDAVDALQLEILPPSQVIREALGLPAAG